MNQLPKTNLLVDYICGTIRIVVLAAVAFGTMPLLMYLLK